MGQTKKTFMLAGLVAGAAMFLDTMSGQQRTGGAGQAAQGQAGGGRSTTPSPSPSPNTPTPTPSPLPNPQDRTRPDDRRPYPQDMNRPVFLSGKVILSDGTPPPDSVVIERVCNGVAKREAYTDSKGRFSFQLGQNNSVMQDASVSSNMDGILTGPGGLGGMDSQRSGSPGDQRRQMGERQLASCELRAVLPGFRSDVVNLSGRRSFDTPDVGTIILHRLGNVEGTTISTTSLQAPKDARKAYEKSREALKKNKTDDAQKNLEKAVEIYPKYAVAWAELGRIYEQKNQVEDARKAYAQALAADNKLITPYLQLAMLSARDKKWQDVAETTDRAVRLNPVDFPAAYYFNSVANFYLKKFDAAEKSAREAQKLDSQHRIPKVDQLLGAILAEKRDYSGAAEQMKSYLKFAPDAEDKEMVRSQLLDLEKLSGSQAKVSEKQPEQPAP